MQEECDMIPLMMQENFQAKGWLGLILGTRLWHPFWGADLDDDVAFEKRVDSLAREIGDRGKPNAAPAPTGWSKVKDTVVDENPSASPAPAPALAPLPLPAPAPAPVPEAATAAVQAKAAQKERTQALADQRGTPPLRGTAAAAADAQASGTSASFAEFASFFREERERMEVKLEEQRREVLQARQRVSDEQLQLLHDRLQRMHAEGLLGEETYYACEDLVADSVEGMATGGAAPDRLVRMVALSQRLATDASLARQLKRKYG
jgi:hypothetical protein